jgi:polyhydroxybutyrate depolymerase
VAHRVRLIAAVAISVLAGVACRDEQDAVASPCAGRREGVTETTLTAGGAEHPVRVFVPPDRTGQRLPVVLNWHGHGSDGPYQALLTGYEELAEAEGFIVVHPTGVPVPGGDGNSWELVDDQDPGRDDVAFASTLVQTIIDEWCADAGRVYSTGMSNGGFFTARLVCELADRIAAASSIAGTHHPDGCVPARLVPYMAFHGTADEFVPIDGGGQSIVPADEDPVLDRLVEHAVPDEFAEFATDAGCSTEPSVSPEGDEVIRYHYAGCDGGASLTFVEVVGGGHTWPGSPLGDELPDVLGPTTDAVDATAESWTFFEQHTLEP